MHEHDDIRLRHMLEAAREAASFTHGRVRDDLETDRRIPAYSGVFRLIPAYSGLFRLILAYSGSDGEAAWVDWSTDESRS